MPKLPQRWGLCVGVALLAWLSLPPQPVRADAWQDWLALLNSDAVFGDYVDSGLDQSQLATVRQFAYNTFRDCQERQGGKHLAARAIWVAINLEYQAMLALGAFQLAQRQDHAWRVGALGKQLRGYLTKHPIGEIEDDLLARDQWVKATLKLALMESEAATVLPPSAPTVREQVRNALVHEFTPANSHGLNGLLMSEVGMAFAQCQDLAARASAAHVQASFALGQVYGYPPRKKRQQSEQQLTDGEIRLLFPKDDVAWVKLADLIEITMPAGGSMPAGIVRQYADAREVLLVGTAKQTDLLSRIPATYQYRSPEELHAPYGLEPSIGQIKKLFLPTTDRQRLITGRFKPFSIGDHGTTDQGGLDQFWKGFEKSKRSQASLTLAELLDLRTTFANDNGPALDKDTIGHLTAIARVAGVGNTDHEVANFVRGCLDKWLEERVIEYAPGYRRLMKLGGKYNAK